MSISAYEIVIFDVTRNPGVFVALLDQEHEKPSDFQILGSDFLGNFTFGSIENHNVMIASTTAEQSQNVPAAKLASVLENNTYIRHSIVLGTAGGKFGKLSKDIRLGDIVVSKPKGQHGGVVKWDSGIELENGSFQRTGFLDRVPKPLLSKLSYLQSEIEMENVQLIAENVAYPGAGNDLLFYPEDQHIGGSSCSQCGSNKIQREEREDHHPRIHLGGVASGEIMMNDGVSRDSVAKSLKVKCFETDAAKVMEIRPSLCVMGIRNYADSHQQSSTYEGWETYAAAAAATYTKLLVMSM